MNEYISQVEQNHRVACKRVQELENELCSVDKYAKEQYRAYDERLEAKDAEIARLKVTLERITDVDEDAKGEAESYFNSWKMCQRIAGEALSDKKGTV